MHSTTDLETTSPAALDTLGSRGGAQEVRERDYWRERGARELGRKLLLDCVQQIEADPELKLPETRMEVAWLRGESTSLPVDFDEVLQALGVTNAARRDLFALLALKQPERLLATVFECEALDVDAEPPESHLVRSRIRKALDKADEASQALLCGEALETARPDAPQETKITAFGAIASPSFAAGLLMESLQVMAAACAQARAGSVDADLAAAARRDAAWIGGQGPKFLTSSLSFDEVLEMMSMPAESWRHRFVELAMLQPSEMVRRLQQIRAILEEMAEADAPNRGPAVELPARSVEAAIRDYRERAHPI